MFRVSILGVLLSLAFQSTAQATAAECSMTSSDGDCEEATEDSFPNFADFLKNSVFGQGGSEDTLDPFSFLKEETETSGPNELFRKLFSLIQGEEKEEAAASEEDTTPSHADSNRDHFLADLISAAASTQSTEESLSIQTLVDIFLSSSKRVHEQLERTFKDQLVDLNPIQLYYHMLQQESEKDSVWKRRQHRFLTPVTEETATIPMADGLFLSQLAYVDTCDHIREHLQSFHNNSWALLNCTTSGKPAEPAHFLAIRRVSRPLLKPKNILERLTREFLPRKNDNNNDLEVALVIRGSKELADFLSDGMLEAVDYRGGKAHDGILQSARWLHSAYKGFLKHLLVMTGRSKLKLWLVGHSLGAGTAALACMEFNSQDAAKENTNQDSETTIEAYSMGFGTPAVVTKDLSEAARSSITTVINDADCVPRMSGATLINTWRKAGSCDGWIEDSKQDIQQVAVAMKQNLPFPDLTDKLLGGLLEWLDSNKEKWKVEREQQRGRDPAPQVLVPPGECVHFFRDGIGWQAAYTPCDRFDEIEAVRHLVSDHLIDTGYYRGLLGYIRDIKKDVNWKFDPDLMNLPVS